MVHLVRTDCIRRFLSLLQGTESELTIENLIRSPPLSFPGWSCHIQPEGKSYFTLADLPRTVTDVYMANQPVRSRIIRFTAAVCKELQARNIAFPESSELFLSPSDDDENACKYYFVDHADRVEFWVDEVNSETLRLRTSASEDHMSTCPRPKDRTSKLTSHKEWRWKSIIGHT